MPERLVIDASAALGILLREPGSEAVRVRLAGALDGELLVPEHFWLEVTNVLVRRYGRAPDDVVAALRELDEMQLAAVVLDRPAILYGLELMATHGLTAYDAAYLALAEVADAAAPHARRAACGRGGRPVGGAAPAAGSRGRRAVRLAVGRPGLGGAWPLPRRAPYAARGT